MATTKKQRRQSIKHRVRKRISGTAERPRMSVYRSNSGIYVQLIDDVANKTLAAASSERADKKRSFNKEVAEQVGKTIAEKAKTQGIDTVVFDRSGYLYHGKIKALADSAREAGLKF
jgi:large subunit ribosomal protein L18